MCNVRIITITNIPRYLYKKKSPGGQENILSVTSGGLLATALDTPVALGLVKVGKQEMMSELKITLTYSTHNHLSCACTAVRRRRRGGGEKHEDDDEDVPCPVTCSCYQKLFLFQISLFSRPRVQHLRIQWPATTTATPTSTTTARLTSPTSTRPLSRTRGHTRTAQASTACVTCPSQPTRTTATPG